MLQGIPAEFPHDSQLGFLQLEHQLQTLLALGKDLDKKKSSRKADKEFQSDQVWRWIMKAYKVRIRQCSENTAGLDLFSASKRNYTKVTIWAEDEKQEIRRQLCADLKPTTTDPSAECPQDTTRSSMRASRH